jgi:phenylpropionate dioxygenase-like ring-hydroxylating dioxygenase large terminal subunit
VHPDNRREMKATRYLNWRINRRVSIEDKALIERVQAGMGSSGYTVGPLSDGEVCLRSFGRRMRSLIPETRLHKAPPKGWSDRREPEQVTAEQEFEFTAPQLAPQEVA